MTKKHVLDNLLVQATTFTLLAECTVLIKTALVAMKTKQNWQLNIADYAPLAQLPVESFMKVKVQQSTDFMLYQMN